MGKLSSSCSSTMSLLSPGLDHGLHQRWGPPPQPNFGRLLGALKAVMVAEITPDPNPIPIDERAGINGASRTFRGKPEIYKTWHGDSASVWF